MRFLPKVAPVAMVGLLLIAPLSEGQTQAPAASNASQTGNSNRSTEPLPLKDLMTQAASLLAIMISLYTLATQRRMGHEVSTQTLIHDQYNLCRALDMLRVDVPEVSHVLALPAPATSGRDTWDTYETFRGYVRTLIESDGPVTEQTRYRLYLKEHATCLHVANIYEQTVLQHGLAEKARDKQRKKVLQDLLTYYETKMLRNPRFRFHWDHGVSDMMDDATVKQFTANVVKERMNEKPDEHSPLDADRAQTSRTYPRSPGSKQAPA